MTPAATQWSHYPWNSALEKITGSLSSYPSGWDYYGDHGKSPILTLNWNLRTTFKHSDIYALPHRI